uniref:Reverse transcriptase domain-containing protein n=1 Tax=Strongyloides papillosus TaxID=174720 RepID=A0A0N5C6W2_STREA
MTRYLVIGHLCEEKINWSEQLLTQSEQDRIKEVRKENGLKLIKYNAARYANARYSYNQRYVFWKTITDDSYVLKIIEEGYRIPIKEFPYPYDIEFITKEIQRMLDDEVISPLTDNEVRDVRFHLNPIFLHHGTRKDRIIVDCRNLNHVIDIERFTYEPIEFVSSLLYSHSEFMSSIDLSNAYHSIYIHESSQYLLCFKFKDRIYKFHRLIFGLSIAPYIFQRILKVPLNKFREE